MKTRMFHAISRLTTLLRLGVPEVLSVLLYRYAVSSGVIEWALPVGTPHQERLFDEVDFAGSAETIDGASQQRILQDAHELCAGNLRFFSNASYHVGSPPDWFYNPYRHTRCAETRAHWSNIPDFDDAIGDMKCIWEASRWDWALIFARAYRLSHDSAYSTTLNAWASDWIVNNPANVGPNWKCGQETAIRMMQALLTAYLLRQHHAPTAELLRFVTEHCQRIAPTLRYAMAQNNNHGTSEAAALFVGGNWLASVAQTQEDTHLRKQARHWARIGRKWLENRARKLIAPDGSFSQYSVNYHRVVVDTLNFVEFWRREFQLPEFSEIFYERAKAAVNWLYQMVDSTSGDAPNIGANDGARLFALSNTAYRDYRPTVQTGAALFFDSRAYQPGVYDEPKHWLHLNEPSSPSPFAKTPRLFRDGGYVLMPFPQSWAVIRFPNFRFRPSHADAFHLDLWANGLNILRDAGTYSYHADDAFQDYFISTAAHNTIQFDGRNQMPRLSRFLFGNWLNMERCGELMQTEEGLSWEGVYRDAQGCRHQRAVQSDGRIWRITDEIDGARTHAVMRWRLMPGDWTLDGTTCRGSAAELSVRTSQTITRCELTEGWESRYYLEKTSLPVWEIEVPAGNTRLITTIRIAN